MEFKLAPLERSTEKLLGGLFAAAALTLPMAAQADAATTTVRLHAATATGESLQGPGLFGTAVFLAPTNVNASAQKWQKTDVGGGFATYKLVSSIGTSREMCLAASASNTRPFAALCNPSSSAQQWTRGFVNDGRIENHATFKALTRLANGTVEMRFLGGGQVGQNWHEHAA
jgi:hypothetical protein